MALDRIRFSQQARDQLIKLKRQTGLNHWNVICRWAFCASLAEKTVPSSVTITLDSSLEMEWTTFGGEHHEIYLALLKQRCVKDGFGTDAKTLSNQLRLHLHRGIGRLAADSNINSIASLIAIGLEK